MSAPLLSPTLAETEMHEKAVDIRRHMSRMDRFRGHHLHRQADYADALPAQREVSRRETDQLMARMLQLKNKKNSRRPKDSSNGESRASSKRQVDGSRTKLPKTEVPVVTGDSSVKVQHSAPPPAQESSKHRETVAAPIPSADSDLSGVLQDFVSGILNGPGGGGVSQEDHLLIDSLWAEDMAGGTGDPDGRLNTPPGSVEISPPNPGGLHMDDMLPVHLTEDALFQEESRAHQQPLQQQPPQMLEQVTGQPQMGNVQVVNPLVGNPHVGNSQVGNPLSQVGQQRQHQQRLGGVSTFPEMATSRGIPQSSHQAGAVSMETGGWSQRAPVSQVEADARNAMGNGRVGLPPSVSEMNMGNPSDLMVAQAPVPSTMAYPARSPTNMSILMSARCMSLHPEVGSMREEQIAGPGRMEQRRYSSAETGRRVPGSSAMVVGRDGMPMELAAGNTFHHHAGLSADHRRMSGGIPLGGIPPGGIPPGGIPPGGMGGGMPRSMSRGIPGGYPQELGIPGTVSQAYLPSYGGQRGMSAYTHPGSVSAGLPISAAPEYTMYPGTGTIPGSAGLPSSAGLSAQHPSGQLAHPQYGHPGMRPVGPSGIPAQHAAVMGGGAYNPHGAGAGGPPAGYTYGGVNSTAAGMGLALHPRQPAPAPHPAQHQRPAAVAAAAAAQAAAANAQYRAQVMSTGAPYPGMQQYSAQHGMSSAGMAPGMQVSGMAPGMQVSGMAPGMQVSGMAPGMQVSVMVGGSVGTPAGYSTTALGGPQPQAMSSHVVQAQGNMPGMAGYSYGGMPDLM